MADGIDPRDFQEQTYILREILHTLAGGDTGTFKAKTPHPYTYKGAGMFGSAVNKTTESLRVLHGSVDNFAYSLQHMIPKILGGEVIALIIKSGLRT